MASETKLFHFVIIILFASGLVVIGANDLRRRFPVKEREMSQQEANAKVAELHAEHSVLERAKLSHEELKRMIEEQNRHGAPVPQSPPKEQNNSRNFVSKILAPEKESQTQE